MKKKLSFALLLIFVASFRIDAQTIVSTSPANKNVVLEEFTGVNCGYCPDGHRIANQIAAANPGRVFVLNIHQGGYAGNNPNYKTSFGDAIANQTGLTGYPAGTINRHVFSGTVTSLSRNNWSNASNQILAQSSPVNVAAKASINFETREIIVDVEAYYTANGTGTTNKLNVAILQNDIIGPQAGSSLNPSQVVGTQYRHMHMLRHFITGQWGEDITTLAEGSFIEQQYTYTAPAHINNVELVLEDLEIVVFISEGRQEIITAAKAEVEFLNAKPKLKSIEESVVFNCSDARFSATIKNISDEDITSMELTYTLDGADQTINWDARTIAAGASDTILLPLFEASGSHSATVTFDTYNNDKEPMEGSQTASLTKSSVTGHGYMSLKLVTDQYASETSFKIFKEDGSVLLSGGPYGNLSASGTTERWYAIQPPTVGCYVLEVYDAYGDGMNAGYGAGYFQVIDGRDDEIIVNNNGRFGALARYYIYSDAPSSINVVETSFKIYPNPTHNTINIETSETIQKVEIFNLQGQKVLVAGNEKVIHVADLANGIYMLQLTTENGVKTEKFVKQ